MPYINVNTQQIHYIQNKLDTDAVPLVLIHGAGGRVQSWPYLWQQTRFVRSITVRRWLTDFPLYMLDLPGHGRSALPGRNNIDDYAQIVIDFIKTLDLKKVVIVGHSMGGAIAQTIGVRQPPFLAGLILIASGAQIPVTDLILDGLLTDFPKTVHMIMKFSWRKQTAPNLRQVATQHLLDTAPVVVHGDYFACNEFDLRNQLSEISVPALVMGSPVDKMIPLENSQFLTEHIPKTQMVVINDAGHYMMAEKITPVTRAMVNFLNQLATDS